MWEDMKLVLLLLAGGPIGPSRRNESCRRTPGRKRSTSSGVSIVCRRRSGMAGNLGPTWTPRSRRNATTGFNVASHVDDHEVRLRGEHGALRAAPPRRARSDPRAQVAVAPPRDVPLVAQGGARGGQGEGAHRRRSPAVAAICRMVSVPRHAAAATQTGEPKILENVRVTTRFGCRGTRSIRVA